MATQEGEKSTGKSMFPITATCASPIVTAGSSGVLVVPALPPRRLLTILQRIPARIARGLAHDQRRRHLPLARRRMRALLLVAGNRAQRSERGPRQVVARHA